MPKVYVTSIDGEMTLSNGEKVKFTVGTSSDPEEIAVGDFGVTANRWGNTTPNLGVTVEICEKIECALYNHLRDEGPTFEDLGG